MQLKEVKREDLDSNIQTLDAWILEQSNLSDYKALLGSGDSWLDVFPLDASTAPSEFAAFPPLHVPPGVEQKLIKQVSSNLLQKLKGEWVSDGKDDLAEAIGLIEVATDPNRLSLMFEGWTPWI